MKLHDRLRQLIPGRVVRVALLYGGVAWVVFQVVDSTYDNLNLPAFTPTLVLLLLLVQAPVALILAWASQRDERQQPVVGSVGPRDGDGPIKSVAVLPFANMSGSSEGEYLSDGIAEEIINTLVNHSDLRVTSRTSSFSFKGCQDDVRSIGGKLGVGAVLEGSVKRSGERLRVTAQLVSTAEAITSGLSDMTETFEMCLAFKRKLPQVSRNAWLERPAYLTRREPSCRLSRHMMPFCEDGFTGINTPSKITAGQSSG